MATKRALDSFFTTTVPKKARLSPIENEKASKLNIVSSTEVSQHATYPFAVPYLPEALRDQLASVPASDAKTINDQLDLDLLYFQPFIPESGARELFAFLRSGLFFYRVQYKMRRGGCETDIHTPRYTTVFGVDRSAHFTESEGLVDSQTGKPVPKDRWKCTPRPLPQCLDHLRKLTEIFTGAPYNFCLVNYYASGADSISYHSDDESFLGCDPSVASFSLGATRDFCMRHKPIPPKDGQPALEQKLKPALKLPLASGDMVLMKGKTQSQWLHSIPKRKGKGSQGGRINITFRYGVKPYATENYMQYNVGDGCVYKWDSKTEAMTEWKP